MSLLAKLRTASTARVGKLVAFIGIVAIAIGLYKIIRYLIGYLAVVMLFASIIANSNIERSSIKNSRGDTVEAISKVPPDSDDPELTIIRLRLAHHWLSTRLLKAESHGLHYHAKWLDQNTVEITLVFGCLVHLKTPVTTVGPNRISYRLTSGDRSLGSCLAGVSLYSEKLPEWIGGSIRSRDAPSAPL